jgi:hypothetical protein
MSAYELIILQTSSQLNRSTSRFDRWRLISSDTSVPAVLSQSAVRPARARSIASSSEAAEMIR